MLKKKKVNNTVFDIKTEEITMQDNMEAENQLKKNIMKKMVGYLNIMKFHLT